MVSDDVRERLNQLLFFLSVNVLFYIFIDRQILLVEMRHSLKLSNLPWTRGRRCQHGANDVAITVRRVCRRVVVRRVSFGLLLSSLVVSVTACMRGRRGQLLPAAIM